MLYNAVRTLRRASRTSDFTWRYTFNLKAALSYRLARPTLLGETARVLADLNRDGVAKTTAEALLGPDSCFDELERSVAQLEEEHADAIAAARTGQAGVQKSYVYEFFGRNPKVDMDSVYARFALQEPIRQIANGYYGMYGRLSYYNIWRNFVTGDEAVQSQLWHRDPEDRHILKVFVYLSDVDEGAGPLLYARGTNLKQKQTGEPEFFLEKGGGKRSRDEQMAAVIPPDRWFKGVGPRGTIVFADTHGYHKGGLARERERLLYTAMFLSHAV